MTSERIREAISKLNSLFEANPDMARVKYPRARATPESGLRFRVETPEGFAVSTDMSSGVGGAESAPSPGWLLAASLAACTATVIGMRSAHLGVDLSNLEVSVTTEADARGLLGTVPEVSAATAGFTTRVRIGSETGTKEQLEEIVRWSDAHSPVAATIREAPALKLEVEVA